LLLISHLIPQATNFQEDLSPKFYIISCIPIKATCTVHHDLHFTILIVIVDLYKPLNFSLYDVLRLQFTSSL